MMMEAPLILNERDARRLRANLSRLDQALSSPNVLENLRIGLPPVAVELHQSALRGTRKTLAHALASYEQLRTGDVGLLGDGWRSDPGLALIIARIARRFSQSDLARLLDMKEQQVQRYEAERYRSISLQNFQRIAKVLGVRLASDLSSQGLPFLTLHHTEFSNVDKATLRMAVEHIRKHKWFEIENDSTALNGINEFIKSQSQRFGGPGLLRTGTSISDRSSDVKLALWRSRVLQRTELDKAQQIGEFDQYNLGWLRDFVQLSVSPTGVRETIPYLADKGIRLLIEPQITGLKLDGAAFLVENTPVVALTIRIDRIDNFWYTLMHEIAHVFLHYQTGLVGGFIDEDLDDSPIDEMEKQADDFASALLIPPERWRTSLARISEVFGPVDELARQLGIHPAIICGRIRRERENYTIFSDRVGSGEVRKQLCETEHSCDGN